MAEPSLLPIYEQVKPRRERSLEDLRAYRRERAREWRKANPEKARATKQRWRLKNPDKVKAERVRQNTTNREKRINDTLVRRYGITSAQRDAMLLEQGGVCAVCSKVANGKVRGWHVDHCHDTGIVRGILCAGCNTLIGKIEADKQRHALALEYIGRWSKHGDVRMLKRAVA